MRRPTLITALIGCMLMVAATAPAAMAKHGGGTVRTAALHGSVSFPGATGKAKSKVSNDEREFEVEVQHIKSLAGKRVNVFVNGIRFATPRVGSLGAFNVEHSTERGQKVPRVHDGTTVRVRTLGGTLIAGGHF
jgi:hypothetical protein